MTIKEYYEQLPTPTYPKTDFAKRVAERCGVSLVTVKNWLKTNIRPSEGAYEDVLSELSGIPKNELWDK